MRQRLFLVVLWLLTALPFAWAAREGQVQETVLPNGLKVLTKEAHAAPVVSFQVWYRVGSRNERPGITGISHLIEHMMFKGTPTLPKGEISRLLTKNGASFNAGTSNDFTFYYETLASDRLEMAVRIEADRMQNSLMPAAEHKSEMTVVRSELEGGENDPTDVLWKEVVAAAFKAHPYQWPVIGWRSDVEGIQTSEIRQYYRTFYHPNNATVVIVGDFDTPKALALVRKHFGKIPPARSIPKVRTVEDPQRGERRVTVRREGNTAYALMAYHTPAIGHPDLYALDMLDQILSGGRSSRLYQALVEKQLATSTSSGASTSRDPDLFTLSATVRNGIEPGEVEKALLAEAEKIQAQPPLDAEMQKARSQIESYFTYEKDSTSGQASRLGYFETIGSWKYMNTYLDRIRRVTPQQVQEAARKYLTATNRTVGLYLPTAPADGPGAAPGGPPQSSRQQGWLSPWAKTERVAWYRRPSTAQERARTAPRPSAAKPGGKPSPASAPKATTKSSLAKPIRTVLPNGIVVLAQENHSNPTVAITGSLMAGSVLDPPGKWGLSSMVASILNRGTRTRTSLQIAEAMESVGASVSVSGGQESIAFSGRCLTKDFDLTLELLADMLRNPSFPREEMEKLRLQRLAGLREAEDDTASRAARRFSQILYPEGHPFREPTAEAQAAAYRSFTRDDLTGFYERYYGPETATLVIVGDIGTSQAIEKIKSLFGDWPSKGRSRALEVSTVPTLSKTVREVIPMMDKTQVDIVIGQPSDLKRTAPDYYAANVMNTILGGGSGLSSRMAQNIRDKMGLAYGIYSYFDAGLTAGPWAVSLGTNPANVDKAIQGTLAEISRIREKGVERREFQDAIDFITGSYTVRLETNAGVASMLLGIETYGLGLDYISRISGIYRALTPEQVNRTARKYLTPSSLAVVIAGPHRGK
ncbi:MAG: insulinase family protein [Armatimonadetes bacterium]|nr:insulinase family protein [Armatimonadota bacterium]